MGREGANKKEGDRPPLFFRQLIHRDLQDARDLPQLKIRQKALLALNAADRLLVQINARDLQAGRKLLLRQLLLLAQKSNPFPAYIGSAVVIVNFHRYSFTVKMSIFT